MQTVVVYVCIVSVQAKSGFLCSAHVMESSDKATVYF